MTILTNSYHETEYTTRKTEDEIEAIERRINSGRETAADRAFVRRVRKALCGHKGCTCGDFLGRRD